MTTTQLIRIRGRARWPALLVAGLLLGGCAALQDVPPEEDAPVDAEVEDVEDEELPEAVEDEPEELTPEEIAEAERLEEAEARGLDPDDPLDAAILEEPDSPLETRRVHFAFDSSEIREEDEPVLRAHGEFLDAHPDIAITVEGHTDERGSREYNLALGERRAESVKRMLMSYGARSRQVEVVSYGEEAPLVNESNEEAWAQNRRAELLYD